MRLKVFVAIGLVGALAPVGAQEAGVRAAQERAVAVVSVVDGEQTIVAEKIVLEAGQQRMAVEARFTPGAPYSGEAVNESVQLLADSNRISKKSVTRIYRDSEGRTRRETVGTDGQVQSISISDPVAGVSYVLNPQTKTGYRTNVGVVTPSGYAVATGARGGGGGTASPATFPTASVGGRGGEIRAVPPVLPATVVVPAGKTTSEELGQQIVEGVMATGTRTTTMIEAGAIGNERPIQVVSEQWFASDLKVLVATKHTDPRTGESTYRLTNITQAEQPRSLFELPADYTLKESTIRRDKN